MVVEITTFRLAAGADESAFLEADYRVQTEFIPNLPGFVRRTTARGPDGAWLVVVLWGSEREADAAAKLADSDPLASAFVRLIDEATLELKRYSTLD